MESKPSRKPYPSDVADDEWVFLAPYLTLRREDAPQRTHDLREIFNALRWIVRPGAQWRYRAHEFPALGRRLPADPALGCRWRFR